MISFVICANNRWQDYAKPYIESIHRHEPRAECILVDNGSPVPYPESGRYSLVRLEPDPDYNYMQALNIGAQKTHGEWLAFTNDDILCTGPFWDKVHHLDKRGLYGMEIRHKDRRWGVEFQYIYGWILLMHRIVWETVGLFDEYYLHAGFDDIDYSWRAEHAGFALRQIQLPFIHLADQPGRFHRRMEVMGYRENMERSKAHFLEKVKIRNMS